MKTLVASSSNEFREFLVQHGVPVESYGRGSAKTIVHLLNEVMQGECALVVEDGKIVRTTRVLCLDICTGNQVLVEDRQVFTVDGRMRKRVLDSSTGEKMKLGEDVVVTAQRLILEEMPFARGYPVICTGTRQERKESLSYPGIVTIYEFHLCTVIVPREYIPDLVVVEADKSVFYRWEEKKKV